MKFKGLYTAMTAASLLVAPTLAAAAPIATPLTQPATETVDGDNAFAGVGVVILILAAGAVAGGIAAATSNTSDTPTSP